MNIGTELVGSPSILFLDEPTSGLDATASNDILKSLADMASLGMCVIAVIHQPRFSSFMLFDKVLLLGNGGSTVFIGPPGVAVLYFQVGLGFALPSRENPADVLMDIIAGKVTREGDARFKPAQLAAWWANRGEEWVEEFEHLNQGHQGDLLQLDPDMLEQLEDEFDRVDELCTGHVGVEGLLEIFEGIGHGLSLDDARLLMKRVQLRKQGLTASSGMTEDGTPVGSGPMVVTREQLVDLFQSMSERTRAIGRLEAIERYQSDNLAKNFNFPKLDITGMALAALDASQPATRQVSTAGIAGLSPKQTSGGHFHVSQNKHGDYRIASTGGWQPPADMPSPKLPSATQSYNGAATGPPHPAAPELQQAMSPALSGDMQQQHQQAVEQHSPSILLTQPATAVGPLHQAGSLSPRGAVLITQPANAAPSRGPVSIPQAASLSSMLVPQATLPGQQQSDEHGHPETAGSRRRLVDDDVLRGSLKMQESNVSLAAYVACGSQLLLAECQCEVTCQAIHKHTAHL